MADLSCQEVTLLDADAVAQSVTDRARLASHLSRCEACTQRRQRMRVMTAAITRECAPESGMSDRALIARAQLQAASRPWAVENPRWLRPALAAAAVLALGGGVGSWVLRPTTGAPVASAPRKIEQASRSEHAAVASTAQAALTMPCSQVTVASDPNADVVTLSGEHSACRFGLRSGEALFRVAPGAGARVTVETPAANVNVIGTVFLVRVDEAAATQVAVYRGRVQVETAAGGVELAAGQQVLVSDRASEPAADLHGAPATIMGRLQRFAARAGEHALEHAEPPPPAVRAASESDVPAEVLSPRRKRARDKKPAEREVIIDLRGIVRSDPSLARARAKEHSDRPEYLRQRAELLTIIAESYVVEREYARALDAYRDVWTVSPGTSTAANAMLASANLYLDRLNEPLLASALYARYLEAFPRGSLRELAEIGRCRALRAAGEREQARACATAYLATHGKARYGNEAADLSR
jgi:ferric-dicitrate binding protein FerR (iron transport regulator)